MDIKIRSLCVVIGHKHLADIEQDALPVVDLIPYLTPVSTDQIYLSSLSYHPLFWCLFLFHFYKIMGHTAPGRFPVFL